MIKVLQVYPQMNNAGTEKVIMTLYKNIDRTKVTFDFLVQKDGLLDNEILTLGGKIYKIAFVNKRQYYDELVDFLKKSEYKIMHVHTQGNMELILKAGKEAGIKCRIIHSHNARQDLLPLLKILTLKRNFKIKKYATDFFACSTDAAKWLFPFNYNDAKIVYNAVNVEKFSFDKNIRKIEREKLNISENERVIVNVGRFARQKNHKKIFEIAKQLIKEDKNIKILLIGEGPLKEKIIKKVKNNKMDSNFIFTGNRKDVNNLLMAGDLFLFPSFHEGLGIVLVEAQFSGLRCVASNNVPLEADIGMGLMKRISLHRTNKYWAKYIMKNLTVTTLKRENLVYDIENSNYNIKNIINGIEDFYIRKAGN